jgi:hypothetical protein
VIVSNKFKFMSEEEGKKEKNSPQEYHSHRELKSL